MSLLDIYNMIIGKNPQNVEQIRANALRQLEWEKQMTARENAMGLSGAQIPAQPTQQPMIPTGNMNGIRG